MAILSQDEVRLRIAAETTGGDAVEQLAKNIDGLATQGGEAAPALGRLAGELRKMQADAAASGAAVDKNASSLSGFVTKLKPVAGAIAGAFGAQEVARMAADFDSLNRSMRAITGSGTKAAAEIGYITDAAQRLGLDLQSTSKAYTNWLASIKGTALEGEKGRAVFEAVAGSMAKLGKSSADTEGAMMALGQMVAKGTVSMEELRGQLAERLPGALQAAADGAGITVQQLTKMVETGGVLAEDLLPGMAAQLTKLYGTGQQAQGFTAGWNSLKSAAEETVGRIAQSEVVVKAVGLTFGTVKEVLLVMGTGLLTVAEGFGLIAKTAGTAAAAMNTGEWAKAKDEIVSMANESAARINDLASKTATAGAVQRAFGAEVKQGGDAAAAAAPKYLQITAAYTEVAKAADKYTTVQEKAAAARAAEGAALSELATAFGTEAQQREVSARAAEANADALKKVSDAKAAESAIASSQLAAVLAEAAAQVAAGQQLTDAKKDEIQKIREAIAAKDEEAAKAAAAAESARVHAEATKLDAQAYADNSARVAELGEAWRVAKERADALRESLAAGAAVKQQSAAADEAAGKAAKLYRDALSDQAGLVRATTDLKQAELAVTSRGRELQLSLIQTQIQMAKARGDDLLVGQLQNDQARIQIELAALKSQSLRLEADAILLSVQAKRADLEASGQMTEQKRKELKVLELSAQMKRLDADAADQAARMIREMNNAVGSSSGAMNSASSSAQKLGDSWSTAADAADRYASSAARAARSTDGTMNADGTINRTQFTSTTDNYQKGIAIGLSADEAKVFATRLSDEIIRANEEARGKYNAVGNAFGANDYLAVQADAITRAAEYARNNTTSSTVSSATQAVGGNFYQSSKRTIVLDLNGTRRSVEVSDEESANNLVAALSDLKARS